MSELTRHFRSTAALAAAFAHALPVAARSMRLNPRFFAVAVSSLAIALGLSTSVFEYIDSLTHPYVPVREVDHLYGVFVPGQGAVAQPTGDEIIQLAAHMPSAEGIAVGTQTYGPLTTADFGFDADRLSVAPEYFRVLGVIPRLGRLFSPTETEESGVAIVSDIGWKLMFHGRPEIGKATITFAGKSYAVVGVLPSGFDRLQGVAFWVPTPQHISRYSDFIVRLKPGATETQLKTDLKTVTDRLTSEYGTGRRAFFAHVSSMKPDPMRLRSYHGAMIGAAVSILIIACANVAALMLARGVVKRRDQALRLSLGATRADLLVTVAAEVTLLAAAGGIAGAILASWTMHLIAGLTPTAAVSMGAAMETQWTWRVFAESFAAMIAAIALAAGLPAWYASRIAPSEPLKESAGTTTGRAGSRFRLLVVGEVAVAMMLLMGSSLIAKATRNMSHFDFGYDARSLFVTGLAVTVRPDSAKKSVDSANALAKRRPQVTITQFNAAVNRVRGLETVLNASAYTYGSPEKFVIMSDQSRRGANQVETRTYMNVGDAFMKTLGLPIVEGRDFQEGDRSAGGAVILDQLAAKQLFPHGGAVGRLVKLGDESSKQPWLPVIGIAHAAMLTFPVDGYADQPPQVFASLPFDASASLTLLVRPRGKQMSAMIAAQRTLKDQLPAKSFFQSRPWLNGYDGLVAEQQFTASIFVGLGMASLALAAAGLFSVLSYSVGQRMREFAVRVALGADRNNVMRLVLSDGLVMALGGTAIGAILGTWAGFLLQSFLWGMYPADAGALVTAEAVLLAVTMASCIAPAVRATRADPLEILRAT
ncbi:MAG: ABC transporter permease [Gemmatimonadales bacterium]